MGIKTARVALICILIALTTILLVGLYHAYVWNDSQIYDGWDLNNTWFTWTETAELPSRAEYTFAIERIALEGGAWKAILHTPDATLSSQGRETRAEFAEFLQGLTAHGVWTVRNNSSIPVSPTDAWDTVTVSTYVYERLDLLHLQGTKTAHFARDFYKSRDMQILSTYLDSTECGMQHRILKQRQFSEKANKN